MFERKKSVLVTGGRGFLGRAVVRLLRESGFKVVSLDQSPIANVDKVAGETLCNISDRERLRGVFEIEPIDGVIHLAAVLPTAAQQDPIRATEVNVIGSLNLLEFARQFQVRRFVFASSLSIYGTWDTAHEVSEADRAQPEDVYGAGKLYVENVGAAYRKHHGLEFLSLRIGRVVGPGAKSATSAWRSQIFEFLNADGSVKIEIPYAGIERLLLVNVKDVAKALVALSQAKGTAHCVYNAPCESVIVQDLKKKVETLNPSITVKLGDRPVRGNPRLLDFSRFQKEFGFRSQPIFEQLRRAAGEDACRTAGEGAGATH